MAVKKVPLPGFYYYQFNNPDEKGFFNDLSKFKPFI